MAAYIKASADTTSTSTAYVSLRGMGSYSAETRSLEWIFTDPNGNEKTFKDNDIVNNASQTPDKTITGLAAGTTYTITAHVYVHIGGSTWWDSYFDEFQDGSTAKITTKEDTPEIKIVKQMQNAIYVQVNPLAAQSWGRYVKWAYKKSSNSSYTNAYTGTSCTIAKDKTYGADYIFNNLDRNTSYTLRATIYKFSSDNTSSTKQITITSSTASLSPQLTCTTSSQTSLTFKLSSVTAYDTDTQKVYWYYRKNGDTNWIDSGLVTTILKKENSVENNTITGLNPDTRYDIYVEIKKTTAMFDGTYPILCKQSFSSSTYRTKEGASVSANANGSFSIYAQLINLDTSQQVTRYVKWECYDENDNLLETSNPYAFSSSQIVDTNSPSYGIRGLAQGTKYKIKALVTIGSASATPTYPFGPDAATTSSYNNFTLNTAAANACNNHGLTSAFTSTEWNRLVEAVNEVIGGKGWNWETNSGQGATLSAANTKVTSSNTEKILYASMFNSLRYNIGAHYNTGISKVSPEDIVYGAYFVGGSINGSNVVGVVPALNGLINNAQIHFTAPS